MNTLTLAQRVLEAVGADESRLPVPRIVSRIPDALKTLAVMVAGDPRRTLLRKEFTLTLVSGVGDLTPLVTGDGLLVPSMAAVFAADFTSPLQRQPDFAALLTARSPVFGYYAVEGLVLKTANVEDGDLNFVASFVPTLDTLPEQLSDDLVSALASFFAPAVAAA